MLFDALFRLSLVSRVPFERLFDVLSELSPTDFRLFGKLLVVLVSLVVLLAPLVQTIATEAAVSTVLPMNRPEPAVGSPARTCCIRS